MKAERRHDLKTNALARGLEGLPLYWREYGSRALLVVVVALVAYLAVRYWNDKKANDLAKLNDARENVQEALMGLEQVPRLYGAPSNQIIDQRRRYVDSADAAINTLLDNARDARDKSTAYLERGQLNWTLATLPQPPGADTQPALKAGDHDRLLESARSAYQDALQNAANDPLDVFTARMGLAAIAEDKHQWDEARQQYQALADATALPASFRQLARDRLANLSRYEKPALIAPPEPTSATTQPSASTEPSISGTQPAAAAPTTAPAAPTTLPANPTTSESGTVHSGPSGH